MLATAAAVWTLHLLSDPMALTLAGTPAGYYLGPSPAQPDRYIIHLQGGGWGISYEDLAERASTHYGTSAHWTRSGTCPDASNPACWGDSPSGLPDGLQSLDADQSPLFYNAQHVYVAYSDGASFSGARVEPYVYNSTLSLYFRGYYILNAVLDDLHARFNLSTATEVLLKGCSAGGMAVYLHADHIGQRLRQWAPGVRYAAAPGAGLFLDQKAFPINASFSDLLLWGYTAQNASGSTNAACAAAHAATHDAHLCYLAPHVLPYIATPLFISNSLVDSCALAELMELGCDPRVAGNCTAAQLQYVSQYRASMLEVVRPVLAANALHGAFLQACWTHIVEDDAVAWGKTLVQGQTQRDTFGAWWSSLWKGSSSSSSSSAPLSKVVVDGEWGSNPTCNNLGDCD